MFQIFYLYHVCLTKRLQCIENEKQKIYNKIHYYYHNGDIPQWNQNVENHGEHK